MTTTAVKPRPTLSYVESDHKPGIIVRIITLIIEIIKRIFGIFHFWKAQPYELEPKQYQAFKAIQNDSYLKPLGPPPKNDYQSFRELRLPRPRDIEEDIPQIPYEVREHPLIKSEYEGKDFPAALQNMRRFVGSFVDHTIEIVHGKKILPSIEHRMEHVEKASKVVKDLAAIMIQMGFQLKVPIFNMLQQNQITFAGQDLLDESARKALDWLIENPQNDNYSLEVKNDLLELLQTLIAEEKIALVLNDQTERSIQAVIAWVFNSDRTLQFHDTYLRSDYPSAIIEPIYQQCLTVLINKKVDGLCNNLNDRLIEKLPDLIHLFLKTNSKVITDELSGRIADILSHIDIAKFVDDLTYTGYQQTKTYLDAKKKVDTLIPGQFVERNERPDIEAEYIKTCAKKFATLPDAHPKVQEIVTTPRGKDPLTWPVSDGFKKWKESIEARFITEACQTLIDVLFPKKKAEVDGDIVEIDGLKSLWKRVVIPVEIQSIFSEVELFIQRFLPNNFTFTRDAKTMINNMAEQIIIMTAKTQLRDFISKKLFILFKSLITPEKFANLLNVYVGPVIEEQCIELVTRVILSNCLDDFEEDFLLYRNSKKEFIDISNTIKSFVQDKIQTYSMQRDDQIQENTHEHIDRLTSLICHDLNIAFFAQESIEGSFELIRNSLTTSPQGQSDIHHEIAKLAIVPYLNEIAESLQQATKSAKQITKIENSLAEKLYQIFIEKANEFYRVGGSITKADFFMRVAHPLIHEFGEVLTHKDFERDLPKEAIGKYLNGDSTCSEETNIYSEIVLNLLFDIGEFGGSVTEYIVTSFKSKIDQSIAKTLNRFKKDDYLLIGMISKKLNEKFSSKEDILRIFFSDIEEPVVPVQDLNQTMTRISGIMYDFFYQIAAPSSGVAGMLQNFVVSPFLGNDSSKINNAIRKIFKRLFQDELLNANLVFKIKDILAKHITTASLEINQEAASYTGIQNEGERDIEILPFSPGKPLVRNKFT